MSSAKLNKRQYSRLKKGSSANRDFRASIGKASRDISNSLIAKETGGKRKDSGAEYKAMLDKAQASYDKKLNAMSKNYQKAMADSSSQSNSAIKKLQKQLAGSDKRLNQMAEATQKAFNNINSGQQQQGAGAPSTNTAPPTDATDTSTNELAGGEVMDPIAIAMKIKAAKEAAALKDTNTEDAATETSETPEVVETTNTEEVVAPVVKEALFDNVGLTSMDVPDFSGGFKKKNYGFGEYQMRLTDPFGIRNWGARKGKHSSGIDLRLFKNNKPVDYPVAIADGKIVKIGMHGDGRRITPKQGTKGGVYAYIQLDEDPSKMYKIVHLPKDFYKRKAEFMGKSVKRGDILIKDALGTGSMTGPHFKYAIADYDAKTGTSSRNYSAETNDPTRLFFTGKMNN